MVEILIPITLFLSLAVVVILGLYFRYRARAEVQQSLRAAIDRGQELTPEFLKLLGDPPKSPQADLRRGIIFLVVGAGLAVFGLLLGEEDAVQPLLAIASFPCLVGIAYLFMWKFGGRKE
jgi:hypothetical protein